ncbi:STAS domain-containing protein [Phenylobacterium sp.]|uniref:STAS domain-containing protein n=1 Tax=Phenylobacterium sp. TaxID=1871053 RepID=UPI0027304617|nr:STAS domain-containing protein [Phenylobacterium sp.]MDP1616240.1 STAS domain-containing protein [Phenylobacterium sp.]MDP1985764.1 STAS domain-containing protein [Phenylobacterium sp.]
MIEQLVLEGVVVKNVAALRETILSAFQRGDELRLDIVDGTPVDLCGVQLIESARRFAEISGKTLLLERPATGFRQVLSDGGFITDASAEDLRFWFHQENMP